MSKFPVKTFKGLAGTQIAIGLFCVLIGVADLVVTIKYMSQGMERRLFDDDIVYPDGRMGGKPEMGPHHGPGMDGPEGGRPRERFDPQRDGDDDIEEDGMMPPPQPAVAIPGFDDDDSAEKHERRFKESRVMQTEDNWDGEWEKVDNHAGDTRLLIPSFYAVGIWVGTLLIISGSLGVGAARTNLAHRQSGLKTGNLVLNILNIIFFAPALFVVGGAEAAMASVPYAGDDYWPCKQKARMVCGSLLSTMGFLQFVLCIVHSAVSCCCAPVQDIQVVQVAPPMYVYQQDYSVATMDKVALVDNEVPQEQKEAFA
jgi:hypothetical protein